MVLIEFVNQPRVELESRPHVPPHHLAWKAVGVQEGEPAQLFQVWQFYHWAELTCQGQLGKDSLPP